MRRVKPGDTELTLTVTGTKGPRIRIRRRQTLSSQRQRTSDFTAAIKFAVSFSSKAHHK